MKAAGFVLVLLSACSLQERSDFLIGRMCNHGDPNSCDLGQVCLPHTVDGEKFGNFMCRDRASFNPLADGREAPLAFCDPTMGLVCPGDLVCNADRVREDAGARRLVCEPSNDIFAPPIGDGGVGD